MRIWETLYKASEASYVFFDYVVILSDSFYQRQILSKAKSKHFQSFFFIRKSFENIKVNKYSLLSTYRSKYIRHFVTKLKTGMNRSAFLGLESKATLHGIQKNVKPFE